MTSTVQGKGRETTAVRTATATPVRHAPEIASDETGFRPVEVVAPVRHGSLLRESRPYDPEVGFDVPAVSDGIGYRVAKRLMDLGIGSLALLLLSPIMIVAAILIRAQDGGPVIFSQGRVGRGGKLFTCYKFRTMVANADAIKHTVLNLNHHGDHRTFKVKSDPRVTKIGQWLRRLSIDEFPQLWNVLRGDMTLVGPRPPVPGEVALYTDHDMRRLEVKPGLTCLWQISGRGDLPFDQQIVLDLEYIEKRGVLFDVLLLARTVPVLLTAKGAY